MRILMNIQLIYKKYIEEKRQLQKQMRRGRIFMQEQNDLEYIPQNHEGFLLRQSIIRNRQSIQMIEPNFSDDDSLQVQIDLNSNRQRRYRNLVNDIDQRMFNSGQMSQLISPYAYSEQILFSEIESQMEERQFSQQTHLLFYNNYQKAQDALRRQLQMRLKELQEVPFCELQNQSESCLICLQIFETGNNIIVLECNHKYHPFCIKKWMRQRATCPTCRAVVFQLTNLDQIDYYDN